MKSTLEISFGDCPWIPLGGTHQVEGVLHAQGVTATVLG